MGRISGVTKKNLPLLVDFSIAVTIRNGEVTAPEVNPH